MRAALCAAGLSGAVLLLLLGLPFVPAAASSPAPPPASDGATAGHAPIVIDLVSVFTNNALRETISVDGDVAEACAAGASDCFDGGHTALASIAARNGLTLAQDQGSRVRNVTVSDSSHQHGLQPLATVTDPSSPLIRLETVLHSLFGTGPFKGFGPDVVAPLSQNATRRAEQLAPLHAIGHSALILADNMGLEAASAAYLQARSDLAAAVAAETVRPSLAGRRSDAGDAEAVVEVAAAADTATTLAAPGSMDTTRADALSYCLNVLKPRLHAMVSAEQVQRVGYHLREAVDALLALMHLAEPGLLAKATSPLSSGSGPSYLHLYESYAVLGHTRQALTAAQLALLFPSAAEGQAAKLEGLRAAAESDVHRPPTVAPVAPAAFPFSRTVISDSSRFTLGRVQYGAYTALDDVMMGGLGILAGFTGPAPLASAGGPGIPLPVLLPDLGRPVELDVSTLSDSTLFDAPMPMVLVSELVAREVSLWLAEQPGFRLGPAATLEEFRQDAGLPAVAEGQYGPVAVTPGCHMSEPSPATVVQDPHRAAAWSVLPQVASLLPSHAWVAASVCGAHSTKAVEAHDSTALSPLEKLLQASLYARETIARATASALAAMGLLEQLSQVDPTQGQELATTTCDFVLPVGSAPLAMVWGGDGMRLGQGVWLIRGGQAAVPTAGSAPVAVADTAGFGLRFLQRVYGRGYSGQPLDLHESRLSVHHMQARADAGPVTKLPPQTSGEPPLTPAQMAERSVQAMLSDSLRAAIAPALQGVLSTPQSAFLAALAADDTLITGSTWPVVRDTGLSGLAADLGEAGNRSACGLPYPLGTFLTGVGYAINAHSSFLPHAWVTAITGLRA